MRTDDLITLLSADAGARQPNMRLRLLMAALGGAAASLVILLLFYGLRPNLADALSTWRVLAKLVIASTLALTAAFLALRLSRPNAEQGAWLVLLPAPLILGLAALAELATTPAGLWPRQMLGNNAFACVLSVPLLSALPLAAVLFVLRDGAPAIPAAAGAAAGAMAAGIGAGIYALHCGDDSPLFLVAWYGIAALAVTMAGRFGGRRLLRW